MPGVIIQWRTTIRSSRIREKLRQAPLRITLAYRRAFLSWWKQDFIPEGLRQIRTGRGRFPAVNLGRWRFEKVRRFGISHSLGILTGRLYSGFSKAKPHLRSNKRKGTITIKTRFNDPYYIQAIEEGVPVHGARAYPFIKSTLSTTLPRLSNRMKIGLSKEKDILGG